MASSSRGVSALLRGSRTVTGQRSFSSSAQRARAAGVRPPRTAISPGSMTGLQAGAIGTVALLAAAGVTFKVACKTEDRNVRLAKLSGGSKQVVSSSSAAAESQAPQDDAAPTGAMAELEQEADGQAAFDPVTGKINWDCPCLGGMADGPCGEEFKAAFSCFVYSEADPKGVDCVPQFSVMSKCFSDHPDVYGSMDDEEDVEDPELVTRAEDALKA